MSKFIEFRDVTDQIPNHTGSTKIYNIFNRRLGDVLGGISYYDKWKRYTFYPKDSHVIFDSQCLRDIAEFMDKLK